MHPAVLRMIIMLGIFVVVIRFGLQFFFAGILIAPLRKLSKAVREVISGNLEVQIDIKTQDEIGYITSSFNNMVESLRTMVETIGNSSVEVKNVSTDMNSASTELADIARELTAIVEETASAYEEMSSAFDSNLNDVKYQLESSDTVKDDISRINVSSGELNERIGKLTERINEAVGQIQSGEQTIDKSLNAIEDMARYIASIDEAIGAVSEVADKINLLALNAAIEASRAGEHGKGFAVVADEINKLADQTSDLVKGIQETISEHTQRISGEIGYISKTSDIFEEVLKKIMDTKGVMQDAIEFTRNLISMNSQIQQNMAKHGEISNNIYDYSIQQKEIVDELTRAINNINEITQKTLESADLVKGYSNIIDMSANELAHNLENISIRSKKIKPMEGKE
jgi:methyl-accepting chemotaxis protein